MKTTVIAWVSDIRFVPGPEGPIASVLLEDDDDCHKFRVTIPHTDARELEKEIATVGDDARVCLTISFPAVEEP